VWGTGCLLLGSHMYGIRPVPIVIRHFLHQIILPKSLVLSWMLICTKKLKSSIMQAAVLSHGDQPVSSSGVTVLR
jgi:hypothetical protein